MILRDYPLADLYAAHTILLKKYKQDITVAPHLERVTEIIEDKLIEMFK